MKLKTPAPNTPASDALFAALAALIGLIVRLAAPLSASFPLNDGGLFYQMILDLQANHFRLPAFTTYNSAHIPFAYPPFAFYFAGGLASVFHLDLLGILRILPPVISSLGIPAFYYLARRIVRSGQETSFVATLAFALTPRAFEWQIMGGGITRSFGMLFALLTLSALFDVFSRHTPRHIFALLLWGTLTVLSHPEAVAQTLLLALILYLVRDHSPKGAIYALACAAGILAFSAPWWTTMLARYGLDPFLAVSAAARDGTFVDFPARLFLTFQFNFSDEIQLPFIAVLGLIGLFTELSKREFLLPLWVTAPLFFEPRSAPQFMVIPLGMLAGIGLVDVLLPALRRVSENQPRASMLAVGGFVAYLFLYLLLSAYLLGSNIANSVTLKPSDRAAFAWVKENTPAGSRFMILTGAGAVTDPVAEWFPALAKRKSVNTIFGLEWLRAVSFRKEIEQYYALQSCLDQEVGCLQRWVQETGSGFTHVLVHKKGSEYLLLASLQHSPDYQLIYDTPTIAIFEKAP